MKKNKFKISQLTKITLMFIEKKLHYFLLIFSCISCSFSYFILMNINFINEIYIYRNIYILINILLILYFILLLVKKFKILINDYNCGEIGIKLYFKFIGFFSLITIIPSLFLSIIGFFFLKISLENWFSEPFRNAINEASSVAELYLKDNISSIKSTIQISANKILPLFKISTYGKNFLNEILSDEFNSILDDDNIDEAVIIETNDRLQILKAIFSEFSIFLKLAADSGEIVNSLNDCLDGMITINNFDNRVMASMALDVENKIFYTVIKHVDPKIIKYSEVAKNNKEYYGTIIQKSNKIEKTFLLMFFISSLLMLLSAIISGMSVADKIVYPIKNLIFAANNLSVGNLDIKINESDSDDEIKILISAFNSMTEKLKTQREQIIINEKNLAWSEIAKKIAHEVKNPLTPIQLSAERLKKKYGEKIVDGKENFINCIDVIIRQVSQIENLINEFSSFARMPEAKFENTDLINLLTQCIIFHVEAFPKIKFFLKIFNSVGFFEEVKINLKSNFELKVNIDPNQMIQVFNNIIKNSCSAIIESEIEHGEILIKIFEKNEEILLIIKDNGPGFPNVPKEKIFEPYFSNSKNGTGLGMSIVQKIINDHNGKINLENDEVSGAIIKITIPKNII